jgi:hypothetical protein
MSLRLVIAAVVFVLQATAALGAPDPAASCHAAKLKATGKAVGGLLGCHAKASKAGLTPSPTCIARAQQSITDRFAKAEARGGCSSEGDAGAVGEASSGSVVAIVAALRPALTASTCVSKKLGAAGKYGASVLTAHAANVTRPSNANLAKALAKASSKLDQDFAKASQEADCSTSANAPAVRELVDTLAPAPLSLYVNEDVSDEVRAEVYPPIGAQDSFILYQWQFDADADSVPDEGAAAAVAAYLDGVAPVGTTAPVCIDWEADSMSTLSSGEVDSDAFRSAVASFVDFIDDVRALRPDLRFGYYGLPVRSYWSRDADWQARNDALLPILDASDVVFPSVYDFYTEAEVAEAEDLAYVRDNVGEALRLAAGKDVFPYVWHRYHDSNATVGGKLIGEEEFKAHVGAVFEAEFEGARAAGVVWWGADRYFMASGTEPWVDVFAEELPVDTDADAYLDEVHTERLRWLREVLDAAMSE